MLNTITIVIVGLKEMKKVLNSLNKAEVPLRRGPGGFHRSGEGAFHGLKLMMILNMQLSISCV